MLSGIRLWRGLAFLLGFACLACIYIAECTAGTGHFGIAQGYYNLLAEGFVQHHLYLPLDVPPGLLALPNPYDPTLNRTATFSPLGDASLFDGHYYLYWGPFPVIFHFMARLLTGTYSLPEGVVIVFAALVAVLAFFGTVRQVRLTGFPNSPGWLVPGLSVAFALGGMMLYMVGRPSIYHEPIMVAMGAMLGSWYWVTRGVMRSGFRPAYMALSGAFLGAAVASRITYLGYAAGMVAVLGAVVLRSPSGTKRAAWKGWVAFCAPIVITGVLLGTYNYLRFKSPFEFGMSFALQGSPTYYDANRVPGGDTLGSFLDPSSVPFGVGAYLASVPKIGMAWPYFAFMSGPGFAFVPFADIANQVYLEPPIVSVPVLAPVALLSLTAPLMLLDRRVGHEFKPVAGSILLGSIATVLLVAASKGMSTRYSADFAPGFTLLGSLVLLAASARFERSVRLHLHASASWLHRTVVQLSAVLASLAASVMLAASIVVGVLLGLGVYFYYGPSLGLLAYRPIVNQTAEDIRIRLLPWTLGSSLDPPGPGLRSAWQTIDGYYASGSPIYLSAPQDAPVLEATLVSYANDEAVLHVWVNGQMIEDRPLPPGQHVLTTSSLSEVQGGTKVAIAFSEGSGALSPSSDSLLFTVVGLSLLAK